MMDPRNSKQYVFVEIVCKLQTICNRDLFRIFHTQWRIFNYRRIQ